MAHFAELDENNVVLRVIVIADSDTSDANGVEKEHIGAAYCEKLLGGKWVKTSYNVNIRKKYAAIGDTYNAELDAFIAPKPYPSWTLNTEKAVWEAPVPQPEPSPVEIYSWNEDTGSWDAEKVIS